MPLKHRARGVPQMPAPRTAVGSELDTCGLPAVWWRLIVEWDLLSHTGFLPSDPVSEAGRDGPARPGRDMNPTGGGLCPVFYHTRLR